MTSSNPGNIHRYPVPVEHYGIDDDAINYPHCQRKNTHILNAVSWVLSDWLMDCPSMGHRQHIERSVARFLDNLARGHKLIGWVKP